ncbi:MAG: glycosyltransferase family 2 protein [Candidatus Thorarchaeota archaeon]|nr:glycosyltransferase family 2 protein [Candidatus Thorarchaeota archaeon]
MVRVMALTEYFNEEENIPGLVENIMAQSLTPEYWILIDDGSTDNSTQVFVDLLEKYDVPYSITYGEKKQNPSPNLKGRAFRRVQELNSDWLDKNQFDFLIKLDADTRLPEGYIERAVDLLQKDPRIGCFSGQVLGEYLGKMPCGTGKLVRWEVIKLTRGQYWDLDPDALWNIKAHLHGFKVLVGNESFTMKTTRPTRLLSGRGAYLMGQRMAYVRCNTILVITRLIRRLLNRSYPLQFLKGYLKEWLKPHNRWRSDDPDIKYFYSLRYRWDLKRGIRIRT